jgi:hypothetical protein
MPQPQGSTTAGQPGRRARRTRSKRRSCSSCRTEAPIGGHLSPRREQCVHPRALLNLKIGTLMAARRTLKPPKRVAPSSKAATLKKSAASKPAATRLKSPKRDSTLDLSAFPPESVSAVEKWLCLACVLDVFTRHLKLAPRTAQLEMKRYTPSISELYAPTHVRPWFASNPDQSLCPYCGSASK